MQGRIRVLGALAALFGTAAPAELSPVQFVEGLGKEPGRYRIFASGSATPSQPYALIVFLHDYFGSSKTLWERGVVDRLRGRLEPGTFPPFLLVAPDGDRSYWSDTADGRRYETWLHEHLLPELERRYPLRQHPSGRAVMGISMGGFGAVKAALRRPDLWGWAASLSGALIPLDPDSVRRYPPLQRWILRRAFGSLGRSDRYLANDLRTLLRRDVGPLPPRFRLRCGTEDRYRLDEAARRIDAELVRAGWSSELRLEPGGHDWRYWRKAFPELLREQLASFAASLPAGEAQP